MISSVCCSVLINSGEIGVSKTSPSVYCNNFASSSFAVKAWDSRNINCFTINLTSVFGIPALIAYIDI